MRQMSPEQRERKNKYQREYFKEYWIRMSPEQRKKYRERGYKYQRKYWKQMSPEGREKYNKSRREYWKQMSPEQREKRNKRAREYRKRWSPEQRKRYNKVKNRTARVKHTKRRVVVQKYKMLKGCCICGFNKHYSALDFDHINRDKKIKNVSRLVTDTCSWKTVVEEIKKCRVLCANCHRLKTHKNKEYENKNIKYYVDNDKDYTLDQIKKLNDLLTGGEDLGDNTIDPPVMDTTAYHTFKDMSRRIYENFK
jgi:hypothetical protein